MRAAPLEACRWGAARALAALAAGSARVAHTCSMGSAAGLARVACALPRAAAERRAVCTFGGGARALASGGRAKQHARALVASWRRGGARAAPCTSQRARPSSLAMSPVEQTCRRRQARCMHRRRRRAAACSAHDGAIDVAAPGSCGAAGRTGGAVTASAASMPCALAMGGKSAQGTADAAAGTTGGGGSRRGHHRASCSSCAAPRAARPRQRGSRTHPPPRQQCDTLPHSRPCGRLPCCTR